MPFRGDLTEEEYRSVLACAKIREYRKGSLVYSPENECLGLIRVLSGSIRAFMLSEEGREVVLGYETPGLALPGRPGGAGGDQTNPFMPKMPQRNKNRGTAPAPKG